MESHTIWEKNRTIRIVSLSRRFLDDDSLRSFLLKTHENHSMEKPNKDWESQVICLLRFTYDVTVWWRTAAPLHMHSN